MEININCDLGEKSKHHSNKFDPDLLEIVNSANVACGFHAGDDESMKQVVQISKKNNELLNYKAKSKKTAKYGTSSNAHDCKLFLLFKIVSLGNPEEIEYKYSFSLDLTSFSKLKFPPNKRLRFSFTSVLY